ncbi:SacI domain-containing protein [Didymella exigua CBS 183.55]|uniref:SacI domain-containing protein n=1 Tax=Didymella exigua CBS 183.55 TaxID=1150837 RepID=A0A6A5RHQ6_9PLEO|nr:SacI domain-containing protein [Didymella exigua CBS 183.55]KAF1927089.1 SacI domain-containing protein [Didymella exigua CBS 183.55]
MPLVRKLLIFAAVDGLVLQPRSHPQAQQQQAIGIDYKGNVGPLLNNDHEDDDTLSSFEAHGVVGLLTVATSVFLISICGREQVAQIRGKPIYKITGVALIPLASQAEADKAITSTREHLHRHNKGRGTGENDTDSENEDEASSITDSLVEEMPRSPTEVKDPVTGQRGPADKRSSVAEDVMQKKGVYGRFADRWFSRKGWSAESRRTQGLSSEEDLAAKNVPKNVDSTGPTEDADASTPDKLPSDGETTPGSVKPEDIPRVLEGEQDATTVALLPRVIQTTKMYFSSGNFFYSYDYDLSHAIANQSTNASIPLFKQYDPLFFWNQHIVTPFIEAGQNSFVLPVIQGFVGQRPFTLKIADGKTDSLVVDKDATPDDIQLQSWHEKQEKEDTAAAESDREEPAAALVDGKDFLLTLVSRRSIKRAGLRYLRRGIDDEGRTANTVETEQILSPPSWNTSQDKIFSFTQLRGSIPLFFSQSPYSLKPQVSTWGSFETNGQAFKRHFNDLAMRYSEVYVASLIDKHGTEAKIGELYEQHAKDLNDHGGINGKGKQLGFEWFDFHNVCRGMHFENVSKLMDTLGPFLESTGWTEISNDSIAHKQSGILRTNCMDCLDRTNVVQSATARSALEQQLSAGSYTIDLQTDPSTSWFNILWADNGDNISRQYAGTAALKGDFTRTRKRQITGALTDFGLTLTRYYNNIVNDYFAQAVIDYLLGRATETIFAEFEADMKSSDYFIDVRKVRQAAIERCAARVIEDQDEDLIHGWTLSVPTSANHVKTATFEEAVLLLTEKALYFCRLDWGTEKVREFEHVALENVQGLMHGVYITSTLAQRHMDAEKNVGFVIRYRADAQGELIRRNTRALDSGAANDEQKKDEKKAKLEEGRFLAFKALPPRTSVPTEGEKAESEGEVVKSICEEIIRVANKAKKTASGTESEDRILEVEDKDIISLANAKKSTGYLEQIGYSLKKLVW